MKIMYLLLGFLLLGFIGCESKQNSSLENPVIDVRTALQKETLISLKSDVERIEYIPLETTDSCLISNLLSLQISKDFLFMYNGKSKQVFQFDRKGKFVRQVSRWGNGPGEYGQVGDLAIDNERGELYIIQYGGSALVYSFDGNFLRSDSITQQAGGMHMFPDGKQALKGLVMTPIQQAPWAGALKTKNGSLQAAKSLYPKDLKPDVCYMKEICFSPSSEGVLFFTSCNDTVFRITDLGIEQAFVLKRKNEPDYYVGIADINRLRDNTVENDGTIGVYDLFESLHYVYLRLYKGDGLYLQQYNKETGELKSHRVPDVYAECSEAIPGNNVIGIDNDIDGGVPFCPEYTSADGTRAQVASAYIVSLLRNKGYLKEAPAALEIDEDSNPVILLYTFKK